MSGVTIMESPGFHRRHAYVLGARYVPGASELMEHIEESHYTLFAVVPDRQSAQQCLAATEVAVGDLDGANTGMLVAWEVGLTKGILNHLPSIEGEQ